MMGTRGMTSDDTRRIQSHVDKTGSNQDFKARAMITAAKKTTNNRIPR